jgi:hypothetical protein
MTTITRSTLIKAILVLGLVPVLLAACGGSTRTVTRSPLTTSSTTGTSPSGQSTTSSSSGSKASVTTGPVHATLTGQNHNPVAGKHWIYTLVVTDAAGHPLAAKIDTEFALQGAVVGHDIPPTHTLKNGRYKEALKFPAMSAGYPLDLQVVVHTKSGSVTLEWPVTVRK